MYQKIVWKYIFLLKFPENSKVSEELLEIYLFDSNFPQKRIILLIRKAGYGPHSGNKCFAIYQVLQLGNRATAHLKPKIFKDIKLQIQFLFDLLHGYNVSFLFDICGVTKYCFIWSFVEWKCIVVFDLLRGDKFICLFLHFAFPSQRNVAILKILALSWQ